MSSFSRGSSRPFRPEYREFQGLDTDKGFAKPQAASQIPLTPGAKHQGTGLRGPFCVCAWLLTQANLRRRRAHMQKRCTSVQRPLCFALRGEGGIRTRETVLWPPGAFRVRCHRPLGHLSWNRAAKLHKVFQFSNIEDITIRKCIPHTIFPQKTEEQNSRQGEMSLQEVNEQSRK